MLPQPSGYAAFPQPLIHNFWLYLFALAGKGVMTYGLEQQRPVVPHKFPEVVALAKHLAHFRSPGAADPENPLYRKYPERWLESVARRRLSTLDSTLHREPLYSQVPAVAGIERGIIDLLACDQRGRLAVIELKVGEDIHLPLQGLDYWNRKGTSPGLVS